MSDLIFKPIIPLSTMIIFTVILLAIVLINRKHIINRIIILVLLLIISQRPMLRNQADLTYSLDIDVMFVIDNTASMNAIDVNNNTRLNAVKKDCEKIIEKLAGANFSVITFGNYSQVRMPYTSNISDITDIIERINIVDPVYAVGSSLDLSYDDMKILLESSKSKEDHFRVVFYFSDGELTVQEQNSMDLSKFNNIKDMIDYGAVLGYGTTEGGKIRIETSLNKSSITDYEGFLLDKTKTPSQAAISKLDENNLKNVASSLGLDYSQMPNNSKINSISSEVVEKAQKNKDNTEYSDKDLYYYFSMTLLIILFLELLYYRRNEQ